jgi:hypothetical protein
MTDLNDAVALLRTKRQELVEQLDAVDKALAALGGVGVAGPLPEASSDQPPGLAGSEVVATKLKPPRSLSDEHKHALSEGRRKARHSKDAAAGLAREALDPSPGLAPTSSADGRRPRLVKRTPRAG